MPTPAEIKEQKDQEQAGRLLNWLESLEKCQGWTEYLCPKIFASYDAAQTRILDAHAKNAAPDPKDIAIFQGYHEVVTTVRQEKATARARFRHT